MMASFLRRSLVLLCQTVYVVRGVGCGLLSPMVWVLISALTYCVVLAPLLNSLGLSPLRAKTG